MKKNVYTFIDLIIIGLSVHKEELFLMIDLSLRSPDHSLSS